MRLLFLPILLAHTVYSTGVLAALLIHDRLARSGLTLEFSTLSYLALGSMVASALLVLVLVLYRRRLPLRKWNDDTHALRERTRSRTKLLIKVIAFSFLAGGFLFAGADLFLPRNHWANPLAVAVLACSVTLFFIAMPWLALATVWFEADSA